MANSHPHPCLGSRIRRSQEGVRSGLKQPGCGQGPLSVKPVWEVKLSGVLGDGPGRKGRREARTALCSHGILPACEAIVLQMGGRPGDSRIRKHFGIILEHRCGCAWPRGGRALPQCVRLLPQQGPRPHQVASSSPCVPVVPRGIGGPGSGRSRGPAALLPSAEDVAPRYPCGSWCPSEMRAHRRPTCLGDTGGAAPRFVRPVPAAPSAGPRGWAALCICIWIPTFVLLIQINAHVVRNT